jgi:hypothetical protein
MTGGEPLPPLWRCPICGRPFANRNQSHACGVGDLDALFARSEPQVRAAFDRVVVVARRCGPLEVVPEKTRVALQVRMSFAAFTPRHHLHAFRLSTPEDVDAEVGAWLAEAYEVGAQHHLGRPSGT